MDKPKYLKIEKDDQWVRDSTTGALVRIAKDPNYNEHQRKRKELIDRKIKEQNMQNEINTMKQDLEQIKSLLMELLSKGK